jgi:hypothetical protein
MMAEFVTYRASDLTCVIREYEADGLHDAVAS